MRLCAIAQNASRAIIGEEDVCLIFISDNGDYRVYFPRERCTVPEPPKTPQSGHHPALAAGSGGLGAKRASRAGRRQPGRGSQLILFCSCGHATPAVAGLCMSCYRRLRYSALFFGGNRESALDRDGRACRGCQSQHY